ncbi:MAG TPA: ATP synthase F1 subunit delta [Gemmatimonadales bacterium]
MRPVTIAKNYAEALFEAGEADGQTAKFALAIEGVAGAIEADETIRLMLESPRVPKPKKADLLAKALAGKVADPFIRFLGAVIKRGRQGLIPLIRDQYLALVDVKMNRVHAGVTLARPADQKLQDEIAKRLSEVMGMEVIPHLREDPAILGGAIVRVGDRIMDGSLRRKVVALRKQMLG